MSLVELIGQRRKHCGSGRRAEVWPHPAGAPQVCYRFKGILVPEIAESSFLFPDDLAVSSLVSAIHRR